MSFVSVIFGSCKRPLATRTCCVARRASASSLCPLADGRREERRSPRARASGPAEQGVGAVQCRRYHHWSPPGATDTNSSSGTSLNVAVEKEQQRQQRHQQQPQQQAQTKPALPPKSPQAVAMEEFADLERKLASPREAPRRKTPEQVMMEEFAALERKLGSTQQQASAGGAPPVGQSSRLRNTLTKPEEPEAEECCGNGCATCVWIGYWEELQAWEEAEREREEAPP